MLEISGKTNLLEQNAYKYSLQDVAEPNLQRASTRREWCRRCRSTTGACR